MHKRRVKTMRHEMKWMYGVGIGLMILLAGCGGGGATSSGTGGGANGGGSGGGQSYLLWIDEMGLDNSRSLSVNGDRFYLSGVSKVFWLEGGSWKSSDSSTLTEWTVWIESDKRLRTQMSLPSQYLIVQNPPQGHPDDGIFIRLADGRVMQILGGNLVLVLRIDGIPALE